MRLPLALACAGLIAGAANAQFKLYETPSAQRAVSAANAAQAAKDLANRPGMRPLSSLGGSQGTPNQFAPSAPITVNPVYAGTAPAAGYGATDAIGASAKAKPVDPSVDDPNKPRQPLKPKSLSNGVAPR